jgi:tetratricopeptide (TPR) repeat protein
VLYRSGEHEAARRVLVESIALAREMGYRNRLAYSMNTLGNLELDAGALERADQTYREALRIAVAAEEAPLVPDILVGIARVEMKRGNEVRARTILGAVERDPSCDEECRTNARALRAQIDPDPLVSAAVSLDDLLAEVLATHNSAATGN